jgi:predicted ATPase/DNA-binding winged helix-turn-helix (wHTH) protein
MGIAKGNAVMRAAQTREVLSFGPFRLVANERLLTRDGAPVAVSGRALDILIALLTYPNEVIDKKDLLARVWPDVMVEEGSLRFHIARLRKALGDGRHGARYIETLSGRGYCFVAPILRSREATEDTPEPASFPHTNLPARLARTIGREDDVEKLSARLSTARLVTILGAGGVGKTTVAIAIGHQLIDAYAGAVLFIDLSMQRSPGMVATTVAAILGLPVRSEDPMPSLVAHLRNRQILLILDTCEHLIEAVAALASRILADAPQVHILATSRETLQVEGEHVYRLEPLAVPPDDEGLTAAVARTFPATQLFVERATAGGAQLDLSDADAVVVAAICRKLDGVALAIELAARRVLAYGLHQTAALLDQRLTLLWMGSRTAPPRQKTLQATLDWSYGLLSETERVVLRGLAVFVGPFTLEAALTVVTSDAIEQAVVFAAVESLVAKSIVVTRPIGAVMHYRLLDTTRAYVLELSASHADTADVASRHATYFQGWLTQISADTPALLNAAERVPLLAGLNNVRAALEWCFDEDGDTRTGIELASAAAPVFLSLSLLPDCHRWSERAIRAMGNIVQGGNEEMYLRAELALQEALGQSLMYTQSNSEKVRAALERALELAEILNDDRHQLQLLLQLHMYSRRTGNIGRLLAIAGRAEAVAVRMADPAAIAGTRSMTGLSHHLLGNQGMAYANLRGLLSTPALSSTLRAARLGFHPDRTRAVLARTLWLQGFPDQAVQAAKRMIETPALPQDPVNRCIILIFGVGVFQWTGDPARAVQCVDELSDHANQNSLAPFITVAECLKGELLLKQGETDRGIELLRRGVDSLQAERYELYNTGFYATLVEALLTSGCHDLALTTVDDVIERAQSNSDLFYMPELRRIHGDILGQMSDDQGAEASFRHAIELADEQQALSWRLRAALGLARLKLRQGRQADARELVGQTYARFTEGFGTADLMAAKTLMHAGENTKGLARKS